MKTEGNNIALSVENITKTYPGVIALNHVSIDFRQGEVHALVGENGAGKSTLMKVISGAISPDEGTFVINGTSYHKITPAEASEKGIQIVHQEISLVPFLSVTENIFLGNFIGNGVTVNQKEMRRKVKELFAQLHITNVDPDAKVEDLTVAQMQLVEIVKAINRKASVLILDEPTSPLTIKETEILYHIIEILRKQQVTIIYISHRMGEIFDLSDRITILRDGKKISTCNTKDVTREELIRQMVGRELNETYPEGANKPGDTILELKEVYGNGLQNISMYARKGEILGLAGLVGAGRTELVRLIYGADKIEQGEVILNGKTVHINSPEKAVELGIGLLPEDRKLQGLILELSIRDNISLSSLKAISRWTVLNKKKEQEIVDENFKYLRIKAPSSRQLVKSLSGGNQQKVVISKWLAAKPQILIFDEPTRGIDVGAKHEIYLLMRKLVEQGICIIMVSSEMEELLGMADRVYIMREGKISGEIESRNDFSQENIMNFASN